MVSHNHKLIGYIYILWETHSFVRNILQQYYKLEYSSCSRWMGKVEFRIYEKETVTAVLAEYGKGTHINSNYVKLKESKL